MKEQKKVYIVAESWSSIGFPLIAAFDSLEMAVKYLKRGIWFYVKRENFKFCNRQILTPTSRVYSFSSADGQNLSYKISEHKLTSHLFNQ